MLVMSQVGMNLHVERVAVVLQSTLRQQHVETDRRQRTPSVHWTGEVENNHAHRECHDALWTDGNPEDEWRRDYPDEICYDGREDEDFCDETNQRRLDTTVNSDPVNATSTSTMSCSVRTWTRENLERAVTWVQRRCLDGNRQRGADVGRARRKTRHKGRRQEKKGKTYQTDVTMTTTFYSSWRGYFVVCPMRTDTQVPELDMTPQTRRCW